MKRLLGLAGLALALILPTAACAVLVKTLTKSDPKGDVKGTAGLKGGERRALDILRIRAIGHKKVGTVVVLKLGGDFDGHAGRDHMKKAKAELAFVPRAGTPKLILQVSGRRGKARTTITGAGPGTYAAVRRGHTIRFWIARPDFASFRGMRATTRNPKQVDQLKSGVAGAKEGCVAADDIYTRAKAERRNALTSASDTRRMRFEMKAVVSELARRRKTLCTAVPPPPPKSPKCNADAVIDSSQGGKDVAISETCNGSAVDTAVVQLPSGEKVTPNSAFWKFGGTKETPCTTPDDQTVRCTPDQQEAQSVTIFFRKSPTVKPGDKVTLTLYLQGNVLYNETLFVQKEP